VRWWAAEALGRLGDPAAVEPLLAALSDEASVVRAWAARALGQLGDLQAFEPLLATLSDEDSFVRTWAAEALGRSGITETASIIAATSVSSSRCRARDYATALVHLDPAAALPVLVRYGWQFRRESWVERFRGQALVRLGDAEAALSSLRQALEKEEDTANLLALAHFYLEQDELKTVEEYVGRALEKAPDRALCLLSQAVLLWLRGEKAAALEEFKEAQLRYRRIAVVKDLQYDDFWGSNALAAVEAMLAHAEHGEDQLQV
jgi:HEAT repeat protein